MTDLYLSRISLRRDASAAALAPLILPLNEDARAGTAHHLLWSLFADGPDRARDFLWRDDGPATGRMKRTFTTLSARPPEDRVKLFDVETKAFEPNLAPGDRLRFRLRANPARSLPIEGGKRGKRIDPVAEALKGLNPDERVLQRHEITTRIGREWLEAQSKRGGFLIDVGSALAIDGDDWRAVPREGARPITFSTLDFEGLLTVADPALFIASLARGFGKAKAFGCGLMLIRRA